MRPDVSLHDIAPRLARARDQLLAEQAREARREKRARARRRKRAARELHLQWLVDHRDLQLARALHTGNGNYIDQRRRKLDAARAELETYRASA